MVGDPLRRVLESRAEAETLLDHGGEVRELRFWAGEREDGIRQV